MMSIIPDYYIDSKGFPKILTHMRIKSTSNNSPPASSSSPSKFHKYLDNTSTCNSSHYNSVFSDNRKKLKCMHNELIKKKMSYDAGKRILMRSNDNRQSDNHHRPLKPYDNTIFGYDKPNEMVLPPLNI